jgi:hypothetical protein
MRAGCCQEGAEDVEVYVKYNFGTRESFNSAQVKMISEVEYTDALTSSTTRADDTEPRLKIYGWKKSEIEVIGLYWVLYLSQTRQAAVIMSPVP